MATTPEQPGHDTAGAWAKKYYFASRAMIDSVLRPYNLGSTQWYVLHQLANGGPTPQRDLVLMLQVERATLSAIVSALVRKGFVTQETDSADQRQRTLSLTPAGRKLWKQLPDPVELIQSTAFDGIDDDDVAITLRVLQVATQRLSEHVQSTSGR